MVEVLPCDARVIVTMKWP